MGMNEWRSGLCGLFWGVFWATDDLSHAIARAWLVTVLWLLSEGAHYLWTHYRITRRTGGPA